MAIGPCPEIKPGPGSVVPSTFRHQAAAGSSLFELQLEGSDVPLRATGNHPVWSVDRQAFVPTEELLPGEQLATLNGVQKLASIEKLPYNGTLHNLETTQHVYRVGEAGVLVHNMCDTSRTRWGPEHGRGNIQQQLD